MNRERVLSDVEQGLKLYQNVSKSAPTYPLKAVDEYEEWFKTDFIAELTKRLTVENGRWKATPQSHLLIGNGGRLVSDACNQILTPVVTLWLEKEYPKFWQQGLQYNALMAAMQGEPEPEPFNDDDLAQINILVTGEIATQRDHVDHHRRYVERNISAALSLGWTMERFMKAMTVPAGIVGYPYGNTRYSWRTHMERMITGRSRAVFASATESRALVKAGE